MVDRLANTDENKDRIKNVENCFGTSGQALLASGRVLVGEGVLTKLCRKKPKARQFFLFNDILVYGNIVLNKKKYNKQHILPLEEVKIIGLDDDGNFRNGWQIISASKSFTVFAATPTEKAEWMAHIDKCIADLLKKTGKSPSGNEAAVWVPDHSASVCMLCLKTKFTPIIRKHHCRRCGSVVCGPCSSKRFLIPHISSKPVRVCDKCYDKMSSGQVKPDDPVVSGSNPVHKVQPGQNASLSRNEAEKITESGSSADESDGETNETSNPTPTFYEEKAAVESAEPARPNVPPATKADSEVV
ncbi:pleckstrin homology domain-containing family F member 2-like [Hydractinia symbiolongicarpus]|uniref:pleckstrin homology domain-containing family F member 2-like n=1 Tax=Hydractinia symbiolongicarpus TaxID=13093 RepID=UPI00254C8E63|nr:pleckstrin homology domain-containing family F member 2-like [Hydractinia symbiolongicarpus]